MVDASPGRDDSSGELAAIESLVRRTGRPRDGEIWAGDDMAVLRAPNSLLLAADALVEGVHFERGLGTIDDLGWKALAVNLSDVAAMGARPLAAVVTVVGASRDDLEALYDGLLACAFEFDCPVVGGDLSDGTSLVVSVALAAGAASTPPVLRSGGHPGDALFLTSRLGSAAAGLRELRLDGAAKSGCVDAYLRPTPRLKEGRAAAESGASAMIDISDGLGLDLDRLCRASGVGVELDAMPAADGATIDEAMAGGDDYELLFAAPSAERVLAAFLSAGLSAPVRIGQLVEDETRRNLEGRSFSPRGFTHGMA